MSTIRFIHTADLHLDSPFKGMASLPPQGLRQLRESTFTAFANLIQHAVNTQPDFILIVGDIYDGDHRSLRAQLKFQDGMKKLNEVDIPVFISYGNHDHLAGTWTRFDLPSNVHIFDGEVGIANLQVNGQEVVIHGFSYPERHVREAVVNQFPVAESEDAYHIGMLHGSVAGDGSHAVYAPFTKKELLAKRYDYWALGHIHLRQQLHAEPAIVYPGNIQGRHRNEQGWKGFYEVELSKIETNLTFVPTSAIVFERLEMSCEDIRHANEWFESCLEVIEAFKTTHPAGIIELLMTDIGEDADALFQQSTQEEWLDVLREYIGEEEPFVWVHALSFTYSQSDALPMNALTSSVVSTMENWTEADWYEVLKDVYQHPRGIKYLNQLTTEELKEIEENAKKILAIEMG